VGRDNVSSLAVPIDNPVRSTEIRPGRLRLELERPAERESFLYVAENWYPSWKARVDGADAPVVRAQVALMAVPVPAGARVVELEFSLSSYHTGRLISTIAVVAVLVIAAAAIVTRRRRATLAAG
jgi:uncharacterized membrane protein YfhO